MIAAFKKCACCGTVSECRHTGARWLCQRCWNLLIHVPKSAT